LKVQQISRDDGAHRHETSSMEVRARVHALDSTAGRVSDGSQLSELLEGLAVEIEPGRQEYVRCRRSGM